MSFAPPQESLKILVIYNVVEKLLFGSEKDKMAEEDTVSQAKVVVDALKKIGHTVFEMEVYSDFAQEILKWKDKVDVVFNLTEGVGNDLLKSPYVPFILESIGMPFTGASWEPLLLAMDKTKTKDLLITYGIPTANYALFDEVPSRTPRHLTFPLIVKPAFAESSYGIDKNAIVNNFSELSERVKYVLDVYKMPVLVEDYIDGMEICVGATGINYEEMEVLDPYAILFKDLPVDEYPIQTFDSKFDFDSEMYKKTHVVHPVPLDQNTIESVKEYTAKICRLCKCDGYARVDFRVDKNHVPKFLEMNANCAIDPATVLSKSVMKLYGLDYSGFVNKLAMDGLRRSVAKSMIGNK